MRAVAGLVGAALALIAVELALAATSSPVRIARPCTQHALFSGHGVDAATQRVVLDGLARAGCSLGLSREALVLSFASPNAKPSKATERAVRAGLSDALTAATKRGEISGLLAVILRLTIEHAPIAKLISGSL